jgi:hypothetical protein
MRGERWKKIEGGLYSVSTSGRVRRDAKASGATVGRLLVTKPRKHGGYVVVPIRRFIGGPEEQVYLHVLVFETFKKSCPDGYQVNHIDGVKANCRLRNLELATPVQNMQHAIRIGLFKPDGQSNGFAKLTNSQVRRIRKLEGKFARCRIAEMFGVSAGTISHILTRRSWRKIV